MDKTTTRPADSQANDGLKDHIEWLKVLLSLLAAGLLVVIFLSVPVDNQSPRWLQLMIGIIPDALVVLIAIPIIYFLLEKRGLTWQQQLPALLQAASVQPAIFDEAQAANIVKDITDKLEKSGLLTSDAEYLGDFFTAARRLKAAICDGRTRHTIKMRVITARGTFESFLNEIADSYTGTLNVELQVADLSGLPKSMVDPRWEDEQGRTVTRITEYCRMKGYKLTVWQYHYSASVIGHLIDDQHLLMAYYFWDKRTGTIADLQEWYVYYRRSPATNKMFDLFENWFDFAPRSPWTYDSSQQKQAPPPQT